MSDREKVIKALKTCVNHQKTDFCEIGCSHNGCLMIENDNCVIDIMPEIIALLEAQEVATVEPKRIELADETKTWLDKMDAVDALGNIADICIDWDGYRTANGLGGLINEIWAYARYCADRLMKQQEPVEPKKNDVELAGLRTWDWACPECNCELIYRANYCSCCGRAVKWE